jgi:hypothetical protein
MLGFPSPLDRTSFVLILSSALSLLSAEAAGPGEEKFNRLTWLSSDLEWYRGQYESLDALVEALQPDNGWLVYNLMAAEDTLTD